MGEVGKVRGVVDGLRSEGSDSACAYSRRADMPSWKNKIRELLSLQAVDQMRLNSVISRRRPRMLRRMLRRNNKVV